jgi:hypothetical protein
MSGGATLFERLQHIDIHLDMPFPPSAFLLSPEISILNKLTHMKDLSLLKASRQKALKV